MTATILDIKHLTASYQEQRVLVDCDFRIQEGEMVGIIGKSGIGKSTFLEAILGNLRGKMILSPNTQMLLDGIDWAHLSLEQRRPIYREKIGVVFQNAHASFDKLFTIGEQLHQVMREATNENKKKLLEQVHLEETVLQRYPDELSGGMIQRVALMMAMCNQPRLIVADEPYSAMDLVLQEEMMQLLKSYVQSHHASAIIVTHHQALAEQYTTRVLTLEQGHFSTQLLEPMVNNPVLPAPAKNKPLITVSHLSKCYVSHRPVLKEMSLTIYEGDFLGVIGNSGAGKTTLGKILAGLLPYQNGKIDINGSELSDHLKAIGQSYYQEVQYIFQNSLQAFNPRQTILKSLEEPLRFLRGISSKKERLEKILQLFRELDLDETWLEKYPQQLSGGQCQRCAIVRALLVQPKLLICDEITSALDEENQQLILNLLKKLHEESHLTIMMISHQVPLIKQYANHVMVVQEGTVVDDFSPETVQLKECHPFTQILWQHD